MDANQEFIELLTRAGWSQAEAARQLDLPPPQVSRYLRGLNKPDRQTLRLFRLLLHDLAAPDSAAFGELSEKPTRQEEYWRQRALAVERELAEVKETLRSLLATKPAAVSSKSVSDAQRLANVAGGSPGGRAPSGRAKTSPSR